MFRPDLQGLRAIAIILVVLSHAEFPFLTGGFVGVDIFFVLSGFLISGLLIREYERNGRISFSRFYARRLKRLLPALLFVLAVMTACAFWLLSFTEVKAQLGSAIYASTWTSNIYFALRELDYFDELAVNDLFLHTWSLGVEEQFYLVWPLLLLFALKFHRKNLPVNKQKPTLVFLGVVIFASLSLCLYLSTSAVQFAFYLMPSRIWQFSFGALVYVLFTKSSIAVRQRGFVFYSGLVLVIGSGIVLHSNLRYPGVWAILPSLGAALIILAGSGQTDNSTNPLANPVLVWIGDRSYSWYLWHWPVLIIGFSLGFKNQPWQIAGLVSLSLFLATLSYKYVELPFWKGRYSQLKPGRSLLFAILLMLLVVAAFFHLLRSSSESEMLDMQSNDWRLDVPGIYSASCDAWYRHARVEPCLSGDDDAERNVVVLGDSIGMQWLSIIPAIFTQPDWRTVVLTKSSCPIVDEDIFDKYIGRVFDVYRDWRNLVLELMQKLEPDIIVLGSSATYDFSETQWVEGSERIFEQLSESAGSVLVIAGTPTLGFDGPGCITRHLSESPDAFPVEECIAEDRNGPARTVANYLSEAADRFPNVYVLNFNDLVCPEGTCQAGDPNRIVVFRDSQHLTDSFVRSLIPEIRQRINKMNILLDTQ